MVDTMQEAHLSSKTAPQSPSASDRQRSVRSFAKTFRTLVGAALLAVSPAVGEAGDPKPAAEKQPGPLVIAGGGVLPIEIHDFFVEQAGGREGKVVVIPAHKDADREDQTVADFWRQHERVRVAVLLHARTREQADDDEFTKDLDDADGVWFGGGEQERLEKYAGTKAEDKVKTIHRRGGVVGGTSAGAAFFSRKMIRKGQWEAEMGTGIGMVDDTIFEQHYKLREGRKTRFDVVRKNFPEYRAIAVEDNTAAILQGARIKVLGDNNVHVFPPQNEPNADKRVRVLKKGDDEPLYVPDMTVASPALER